MILTVKEYIQTKSNEMLCLMLDSIKIKLPLSLFYLKDQLSLITLECILFIKDFFLLTPLTEKRKENYEFLVFLSSLYNIRYFNLCDNIIFYLFKPEFVPRIRIQQKHFNYFILTADKINITNKINTRRNHFSNFTSNYSQENKDRNLSEDKLDIETNLITRIFNDLGIKLLLIIKY